MPPGICLGGGVDTISAIQEARVLVRLAKTALTIAIATFLVTSAAWGQETKKDWKDRAEYDLYAAIEKETNNTKKLELLNSWREKYPETDFKVLRLQHFLFTYRDLNQPAKMMETAKQMLAINPKDIQAMYWVCTLSTTLPKPDADDFDQAEKAANSLVANVQQTFAADKRPQTTNEADWNKAKADLQALAHKTLGWVAMQRKNNERAETEFRRSLELKPDQGEVSFWMGTVMIAQKKPEKSSPAIFQIARAATYDGPGALNPQGRQEVNKYLEKLYTGFHGSAEGLEELRSLVKSRALPPADFKVMSAAEVAIEKEEQLKRENPMLALWLSIKKELTGPGGKDYWENRMKTALLPGDAVPGVTKLKGKLVAQKPERNPKELVIAISDETTPEVTLSLDQSMRGTAEPGTEIAFEGVATQFAQEPFMVTFEVERSKVDGWPPPAPPAKKGRK
jgi:tetratricopeptide (TPR) repeat protein